MKNIMQVINVASTLSAEVKLNWLTADQGGRKRPIAMVDYAATAYFADGDRQLFSIILHFLTKLEGGVKTPTQIDRATMEFLAPELVAESLADGIQFCITEGAKVVAKGEVLSVKIPSLS
jgi:translation elongation factor EF-Tu-like GTPase